MAPGARLSLSVFLPRVMPLVFARPRAPFNNIVVLVFTCACVVFTQDAVYPVLVILHLPPLRPLPVRRTALLLAPLLLLSSRAPVPLGLLSIHVALPFILAPLLGPFLLGRLLPISCFLSFCRPPRLLPSPLFEPHLLLHLLQHAPHLRRRGARRVHGLLERRPAHLVDALLAQQGEDRPELFNAEGPPLCLLRGLPLPIL
mmetsp:Transcript_76324/g.192120  ORF Transcript_76324/g.192120 Transcript_76324/m.192120 type:complete len:201 (+) Transcript_76324:336-938(+)